MLLNIVTDEELLASQIVKTILFILVSAGIIYNIFRIIRTQTQVKKFINLTILILLTLVLVFVIREFRVEAALVKYPEYVTGTTVGTCSVVAKGKGIEFEYEVNGKKYRNCNTYHPVSIDSIIVPGGKYRVRFSKKFPGQGRMDFMKKIE